MIEEGIVQLLGSNTPLMAIVSAPILPVYIPENAVYPCLRYLIASSTEDYDLASNAIETARIQFDIYAETYGTAKAGQRALHNLLKCYKGTLNGGTRVLVVTLATKIDAFEEQPRLFRATTDYNFQFVEP